MKWWDKQGYYGQMGILMIGAAVSFWLVLCGLLAGLVAFVWWLL